MNDALLVSAGEASADRIAAEVLRSLGKSLRCLGMGGEGTRLAGLEQIVPMSALNIMGFSPVLSRLNTARLLSNKLLRAALDHQAKVALLVGTSEFNQLLGRRLRSAGIRVLFCVPPQVWAWRASRLKSLRASVDRLAVILPFEEALWRSFGYDAHYVGHPSLNQAAAILPKDPSGTLAVLTGSRDQEARAHGAVLTHAAQLWCQEKSGRKAEVLIAPSLSEPVAKALGQLCETRFLGTRAIGLDGASFALSDYDAALSVSGTATLECALAGCPPVIVYRASWLTLRLAKLFLTTPWIGLPNILLGESVFPELLCPHLNPNDLVRHLDQLLFDRPRMLEGCERVRSVLVEALNPPEWKALGFGDRVAKLLDPLF